METNDKAQKVEIRITGTREELAPLIARINRWAKREGIPSTTIAARVLMHRALEAAEVKK